MLPIEMRIKAERRLRRLIYEEGWAQPNVVQYGTDVIRLFWDGARYSVIVNVTDSGEVGECQLAEPPLGAKAGDRGPPGMLSSPEAKPRSQAKKRR